MVTFEDIKRNEDIKIYIETGNNVMGEMKYTEHGYAHAGIASSIASSILNSLGYDARTCELASIAGYMHDIGNSINRHDHAQSGALMAFSLLNKLDVLPRERIIHLTLSIDTKICAVMDYFEIFLSRMLLCRKAAEYLGCRFTLDINGTRLL